MQSEDQSGDGILGGEELALQEAEGESRKEGQEEEVVVAVVPILEEGVVVVERRTSSRSMYTRFNDDNFQDVAFARAAMQRG